MFEHGKCIVLKEPQEDLQAQAIEILKEWGTVVPRTSLGDFNVLDFDDLPGWSVIYPNPDIANYVDSERKRS